jgi:hypothetical protein
MNYLMVNSERVFQRGPSKLKLKTLAPVSAQVEDWRTRRSFEIHYLSLE